MGAHDEFADVEASHDGLACAGIVGEDEPEWLGRQHRLVNGGDLVRERVDVGRVDGHHRVEQESQINALGFNDQFEGLAIAFEGPWTLGDG